MTKNALPARIVDEAGLTTLRPISQGAEKWLFRPITCLDHGFVYMCDYMGNDHSIVQAANVSFGRGTKKVSEDDTLIRYLRRNMHTSPSEMVVFKFHCKMPIFVARQWIRHRTASVNEYSARYSKMSNEFYMPPPDELRRQSTMNKQGRGELLTDDQCEQVAEILGDTYRKAWDGYHSCLDMDLARELARIGLSVANYTEWYWKIDAHNLFHFFRLRLDPHAQKEIRVYAEAMARMVKDAIPKAYRALEMYTLNAMTLSEMEIAFIQKHPGVLMTEEELFGAYLPSVDHNEREAREFVEKMKKLSLVKQ